MHRGEKGLSVSEVIPMSLRQIYQVYDALAQAAATLQQANFRLKCEGFVACLLVCFCVCALICLFHRTACSEAVSRQGGAGVPPCAGTCKCRWSTWAMSIEISVEAT